MARKLGEAKAPPLAVVGSQTDLDEDLFGRVFDPWVVRRFMAFLAPYRRKIAIAIGAVLVFTATQLTIPLIMRSASAGPSSTWKASMPEKSCIWRRARSCCGCDASPG